jgi:hypothetical protein
LRLRGRARHRPPSRFAGSIVEIGQPACRGQGRY